MSQDNAPQKNYQVYVYNLSFILYFADVEVSAFQRCSLHVHKEGGSVGRIQMRRRMLF